MGEIQYSEKVQKWRIFSSGSNFFGKCDNIDCEAFRKEVVCPIGFGIFRKFQKI